MKVKIFVDRSSDYDNLEAKINKWLSENPCFIDVKFATQSATHYNTIISLFYEETGIKDKGDFKK
jgi:hypothetical protein